MSHVSLFDEELMGGDNSETANERAERHSRNVRLSDIGVEGQGRLADARVLVVGAGGLGAPVISYLAAAGVGRLTIVDDDRVERSNLNRQVLFTTEDIGLEKAVVAATRARALDPALDIEPMVARVTVANARELVRSHDVVVDCTDGLPAKYLLNDACVREGIPLVHGAVTALVGQVLVVPRGGRPCLRCLFDSLPPEGTVPSCQTVGVLGAACGVIGSLLASECVKLLVDGPPPPVARFLTVDLARTRFTALAFEPRADCDACGPHARIDARDPDDYRSSPCTSR
jgi:molybdopterin/thiamine biosynthesis adenylyltransferase